MNDRFLSCSGLGFSPARMVSAFFHSPAKLQKGFGFEDRDVIFTHQGRYAINLVCQALHIGPGDEVLVPAYNCGAEVDPYVWTGAKAVFYRINNRAAIDMEDILRRATASTRLIHVTHFFGWPQEIRELAEWCKKRGICLLEDCAQALFSKGPNDTIGKTGDAAIYSFVKSLALPDGGALMSNCEALSVEKKNDRPPQFQDTLVRSLPLLKKWIMHNGKSWQRYDLTRNLLSRSWLKKPADQNCEMQPEMPKCNYFDASKVDWSISRISRGVLGKTLPNQIFERRRSNYLRLHTALSKIPPLQLLFDGLPDDVCPLAFPVFVQNRKNWEAALEDRGILVGGWPSYHRGFDWKEFPEARHLKNDLLTLPVHQDLNDQHMEYIAQCVRSVAG